MPKRSGGVGASDSDDIPYEEAYGEFITRRDELLEEAIQEIIKEGDTSVWKDFFFDSSMAGPLVGDDFEERKARQLALTEAKKKAKTKRKMDKMSKTLAPDPLVVAAQKLIALEERENEKQKVVLEKVSPVDPVLDRAMEEAVAAGPLEKFLVVAFPNPRARAAAGVVLNDQFVDTFEDLIRLSASIASMFPQAALRNSLCRALPVLKTKFERKQGLGDDLNPGDVGGCCLEGCSGEVFTSCVTCGAFLCGEHM